MHTYQSKSGVVTVMSWEEYLERKNMKKIDREEITKISKKFTKVLDVPIEGSCWLVCDPLSAYLSFLGYANTLKQIPANDKHPQVLIMIFEDGSQFIPAGSDLSSVIKGSVNWIWL